jgi:hypothetical protein
MEKRLRIFLFPTFRIYEYIYCPLYWNQVLRRQNGRLANFPAGIVREPNNSFNHISRDDIDVSQLAATEMKSADSCMRSNWGKVRVPYLDSFYGLFRVYTLRTINANLLVLWLYSPLLGLRRVFSFLILYTVGRIPGTGYQPVARPLPTYRTTQTSMPRVRFEPTIPVLERAKTVHALDRAATVIDKHQSMHYSI